MSNFEKSDNGPSEDVVLHRIKKFTVLMAVYTVDYDDPKNFLTVHRGRFMGGEIFTITERDWFVKVWSSMLFFFYLSFGLLIWKAVQMIDVTIGPLIGLMVIISVIVLPFTLLYLNVVIPWLFSGTYPMDVRERAK